MYIANDQHDKIIQVRHGIGFQYLSYSSSTSFAHSGLKIIVLYPIKKIS